MALFFLTHFERYVIGFDVRFFLIFLTGKYLFLIISTKRRKQLKEDYLGMKSLKEFIFHKNNYNCHWKGWRKKLRFFSPHSACSLFIIFNFIKFVYNDEFFVFRVDELSFHCWGKFSTNDWIVFYTKNRCINYAKIKCQLYKNLDRHKKCINYA